MVRGPVSVTGGIYFTSRCVDDDALPMSALNSITSAVARPDKYFSFERHRREFQSEQLGIMMEGCGCTLKGDTTIFTLRPCRIFCLISFHYFRLFLLSINN